MLPCVFYLIQNLHYLESGRFILRKTEQKEAVEEEDRTILELAALPDGYDFDQAFSSLFTWCQIAFVRIEDLGGTCYTSNADQRPYHVHWSCRTAWAWVNARQIFIGFDVFLHNPQGALADCRHKITVRPEQRLPIGFFQNAGNCFMYGLGIEQDLMEAE